MQIVRVGNRDVAYALRHHHVLLAWVAHRRRTQTTLPAPHLVTIDQHPDLADAFRHAAYYATNPTPPFTSAQIAAWAVPHVHDLSSFAANAARAAVQLLTNQEHIDAARQAGVIDKVFVLHSDGGNLRPAWANIWRHRTNNSANSALSLEPVVLDIFINGIEATTGKSLEDLHFILDIDLDYFTSAKAVNPTNEQSFHRLIRAASSYSLALEPSCVRQFRLPGEAITSKSLKLKILDHIARA